MHNQITGRALCVVCGYVKYYIKNDGAKTRCANQFPAERLRKKINIYIYRYSLFYSEGIPPRLHTMELNCRSIFFFLFSKHIFISVDTVATAMSDRL